jgi:hypothetical protein
VVLALACGAAAQAATPGTVELTSIATGQPEPILSDSWQGSTGPGTEAQGTDTGQGTGPASLALRACFHTPLSLALLTETFTVYDAAQPLAGAAALPCYDPGRIAADLATGAAVAFLSARDIAPGVDRVVAVYPDGRAFVWQQPNDTAGKN